MLSTLPKRIDSLVKPHFDRRCAINVWQPPSSGVTDLREINSLASSNVSEAIYLTNKTKTGEPETRPPGGTSNV
jgi:hypothetical protein